MRIEKLAKVAQHEMRELTLKVQSSRNVDYRDELTSVDQSSFV